MRDVNQWTWTMHMYNTSTAMLWYVWYVMSNLNDHNQSNRNLQRTSDFFTSMDPSDFQKISVFKKYLLCCITFSHLITFSRLICIAESSLVLLTCTFDHIMEWRTTEMCNFSLYQHLYRAYERQVIRTASLYTLFKQYDTKQHRETWVLMSLSCCVWCWW